MAFPSNYRIGIIADTHDRWNPRVSELFREVDEIWHLGDVCDEPILDELRAINPKLTVVLGNNDFQMSSPLTANLEPASAFT
jgi:predicted phosphodiesterase